MRQFVNNQLELVSNQVYFVRDSGKNKQNLKKYNDIMVGINMDGAERDRVMNLIHEKDRIESEIRDQYLILETDNIGMEEPLVDQDGFPRTDIDVYKVRHARHRIICLQNDHKNIMRLIERGLTAVHSNLLGSSGEGPSNHSAPAFISNGHVNGTNSGDSIAENEQCFAIVGLVHNGSPADLAGLCEYDEILQFGSVNFGNFEEITQINDIVAHSVGQRVTVKVRRQHQTHNLTVVPRPWQQPGLLGCHIQRKS